MKENKTIVIVGDSWACGEWNTIDGNYQVMHDGLAEYLKNDGYQVVNLSKGGASNFEIINKLKNFLNRKIISNQIDKIFVFQSAWTRDFLYNDILFNQELVKSNGSFLNFWYNQLSNFYQQLSDIAVENNQTIYIVGGVTDTFPVNELENQYPGCCVVCQSFVNLLVNNNHMVENPVFGWYSAEDEQLLLKLSHSQDDKINITNAVTLGMERENLLLEHPKMFYPDNKHPNRTGHKILFEHLKNLKIV